MQGYLSLGFCLVGSDCIWGEVPRQSQGSEIAANKTQNNDANVPALLVLFGQGIPLGEFDVFLHNVVLEDNFVLPRGGDRVGSEGIVLGCFRHVDVEFFTDTALCLNELLSIILLFAV